MTLNQLRRIDLAVSRDVTLATMAERLSGLWGDRLLATELPSERALTYRQAAELVARWSDAIADRSGPGLPVVIATPNCYDQFLLCLSVARAGGLPVPVNPQMRPVEVDHVIADAGAELVIRSVDELAGTFTIIEAARPDPAEIGALFYTSGTTGRPKGAALTHRALVGQSSVMAMWPAQLRRDEVVAALPVAHIMGFVTLVAMATGGLPVCFLQRFRAAAVLDAIESRRATGFIGVPSMYRMMEEAGASERDLSSIRVWGSGADVMPPELAKAFKSYGASATLPLIGPVGEATFAEGYGMVEVGGGVAAKVSLPYFRLGVGDTVGFRLPGYKFRVVDSEDVAVGTGGLGELWVKGPGVLTGYWNSPEASAAALTPDGWLRTGDLVRVGPLGTVVFCGRLKHVIKSGGYSVYPVEVEAALEEHPDVVEAAVVGLSDAKLGEVPVAVVRVRARSTLTPEQLVEWSADRMSHYKAPRRVVMVGELPRTGTDKVQKERLAELFS